ncbi:succinate dehydrogenase assembly factor 1, mitochondrial isoform X3 [Ambystoma mexicanum]
MKIGLIIVDGGLRRRISHKQNLQLQSEGTLYHWGPCTGTTSKHRRISHKICNCGLKELCVSLEALYRHDIQAQGYDVLFIMIWCDRAITDAETSLLQKTERFPFSVLQGTDITRSTKK